MLEGLVAGLLNRFLGMYVKNFDPTQLKVGIWSGDVKLRNLELRKEALDQLKLPINVVEGYLGELTLVIPWSNLRGAPVKIFIEDVFLLASPKEEAQYNEDEEERRKQRIKMEKLDSAELLKERSQEGLTQEEQKKSQSFTDSLVTKIVDNLQVTVKNIHVRYEDSISAPGHPFALGVTLEEFSAISTDGNWKPTFIQDSSKTTHKLATLGALSVYWNTDTKLYGSGRESDTSGKPLMQHDQMIETFKAMIGKTENNGVNHQFILKPVSGQAKIEMDKSGDIHAPKWKANLLFDEIGLVLDDHQYRDSLMMVDLFHYFIRHQEYKKYQPKGVTPKEDPKAWLKFAGEAILRKIHERNRRWSWDYFKERRDDRIRYIELFRKKKQSQQLSPEENEDLSKLEWKLDYEDLRFWRSLARNQLKKENAAALRNHPPQQEQQQQGWVAWMWGSKPQEQTTASDENTQMTAEQRQELYDAIDWDEKAALADDVETPRDALKFQVEASLSTGSFTLRQSPHENTKDLLSLHFDLFKAKALARPDSFLTDVSLGGLRVDDGTTPDSLFPEIVRVKDAPKTTKQSRLSIVELEESSEEAFFQLQLEQNPLDGQGDFAVKAKLKPLEIVWNPNIVVGVVDFFRPPDRHMESINALMETAGATVEDFRQQTRAGLEFALEEHKTINAMLDLQAPLIIIPESITTRKSTCMILDAGHISVNSELVDKDTMKEVQSKQREAFTDEDFKRLESFMYDKFIVKLTSTQLLIGPSIEETKAQLIDKNEELKMHIVEQINIDFLVQLSILPKAPNLSKLRVSGHLPLLHVAASDTKYKSLMKLIDVALPKFGDDTVPEQEPSQRPRLQSSVSMRSNRSALLHSPNQRRRESSQLIPFTATKEQAIVLDDIDEEDEDFEDADDGQSNNVQLQVKQKTFELKFTVDELRGSLFKSDPDGIKPDALLVELVAESFEVNFSLRPFDMVADVSLGSVTVDDFVDQSPAEFKSIVSSGDTEDKEAHRALVKVNVVRVKKESPEFMSVYEGVETNVNMAITTINLVVTRKTLLTLLDFVLVTFTSPGSNSQQKQKAITDDGSEVDIAVEPAEPRPPQTQAGAIRVKVDLKSIQLVLNNDGIRLATLSFNQADIGVFIFGSTMRVNTKLGDLSLIDDVNLGVPEDSSIRKLITIHGDDLADFRYETFDSKNEKSYPGYDSSIYLRAGSIKVNFLEEPFRKIVDFMVKFGKMQAIYNAARQAAANQAQQLQQSSSRIKLDVVINTPIVVFPSAMTPGAPKRDLITAYLGEIYAQNKFAPLDDSEVSEVATKMSAGIRNIRLTSLFHYANEQSEELELIDHVDLGFNMVYAEHKRGAKRPEMEIEGSMTDLNLKITQYQLQALLAISRSVPAAFSGDPDVQAEQAEQDVDSGTLQRARTLPRSQDTSHDDAMDMKPELQSNQDIWTKLDLAFNVPTIGLELVNASDGQPVGSPENASLGKFSLDDSRLKTRMLSNGSLEAEFVIQSFTISDSRPGETNKFRRIMTSGNKSVQQFMASVTMSGGKDRSLIAMAAIDSPKIIFALDYLFALQNFIMTGLTVDESSPMDGEDMDTPEESDAESLQVSVARRESSIQSPPMSIRTRSPPKSGPKEVEGSKMSIAFRVNIVDAQVILIANPLSSSSEAIVLGTKQVLLSQQHALTFQVSEVGMFLCRMDRFEDSRLRIIDDFSVQLSMDSSQPDLTSLHIDLEPLILRLSLRDILLALQIISRASELSAKDDDKKDQNKPGAADQKAKELGQAGLKQRTASGKGPSTVVNKAKSGKNTVTTKARNSDARGQPHDLAKRPRKREQLSATIDGIRVVLIGDLHELPIMDLSIKNFTATAEDWSSSLKAEVPIETYINVYNFSKSAWEPLLEPWAVGLGVAKEQDTGLLSVDMASRKTFDVTITTNTIALASKSFDFLTQDEDVLAKPRGTESPYRIRNYTGFEVLVRSKNPNSEEDISVRLDDGQEAPWSFEHWEKMRENLLNDTMASTAVAVQLEGSGFDPLKNIRLNREGEFIYSLRPKRDSVTHRLMVDVKLGRDNVKYVTLRSPLLVENATQIPVELGVYDAQEGDLLKIEKIAPGESRPAPVGAVYMKSLLVRPDSGFGYSWSSEALWWRDLLKKPTRTMVCKSENGEPFYFQMNAAFDRSNALTK